MSLTGKHMHAYCINTYENTRELYAHIRHLWGSAAESPAEYIVWSLASGKASELDAVVPWPEPKRVGLALFSAWHKKRGHGEATAGRPDLRGNHNVTVQDFTAPAPTQPAREEFSAALSSIGRNHRLIELTFESLIEESSTSHSSESVRSMKYIIESKSEFNSRSWMLLSVCWKNKSGTLLFNSLIGHTSSGQTIRARSRKNWVTWGNTWSDNGSITVFPPIRLRAGFGPEELESTQGPLAVSTFHAHLHAIFNMHPSVAPRGTCHACTPC